MATPFTGNDASFSAFSGNPLINSLIWGAQWQGRALTYSFIGAQSTFSTSVASGYGPSTNTNSEPWSPWLAYFGITNEQAATSAVSKWAAVANLSFSLTPDAFNNCGDIRFGFTDVGNAQAAAYSPSVGAGGDVWFSYLERNTSFAEGSYNYLTLVHEIGHALGLKHPFEFSQTNTATLPPSLDSQAFTVMSYSAQGGDVSTDFSFRPTTPMMLDIQAIQHLYGANTTYNAGNTEYNFREGMSYHQTIWDGGGRDLLSYSGSDACVIDLRPGAGSTMGSTVYVVDLLGNRKGTVSNIWLAMGVAIESASGGSGADQVTGSEASNQLAGGAGNDALRGGAGNDRIDGGSGSDVAVFSATSSNYTYTFNALTGRYAVGDANRARDGTDLTTSVESFMFTDVTLSVAQLPISAQVSGNPRAVLGLSEGFFGMAPDAARYSEALQTVTRDGASSFGVGLGAGFASSDHGVLASTVLSNLVVSPDILGGGSPDLSYALLRDAVTLIFDTYPQAMGQVVLNMVNLLGGLESDSVYGAAAAAFNNRLAGDVNALGVGLVGVSPAEPALA